MKLCFGAQPIPSSLLFHSLSGLPQLGYLLVLQMNAMWTPFWCQAQRRRPMAGGVSRKGTWRKALPLAPMLLQPDSCWGPWALTQATRALATVCLRGSTTSLCWGSSSQGKSPSYAQ